MQRTNQHAVDQGLELPNIIDLTHEIPLELPASEICSGVCHLLPRRQTSVQLELLDVLSALACRLRFTISSTRSPGWITKHINNLILLASLALEIECRFCCSCVVQYQARLSATQLGTMAKLSNFLHDNRRVMLKEVAQIY